jgi:hypothetical protein
MLLVTGNGNIQEGYWKVAVNFFFFNDCVTGRFEPQIKMKNISRLVNFVVTFNSGVE